MNSEYARMKAIEFEKAADELAKTVGEGNWNTRENREDCAYWRGIQYVLYEVESGRLPVVNKVK